MRSASRPGLTGVWFPLDHPYVERCWPTIIGPSGVLLLRRAAALFRERSEVCVMMEDLARDLGIGSGGGASRLQRTMQRLERLRLVQLDPFGELDVFVEVPPLTRSHLSRASSSLRHDHRQLVCARFRELRASGAGELDVSDLRRADG